MHNTVCTVMYGKIPSCTDYVGTQKRVKLTDLFQASASAAKTLFTMIMIRYVNEVSYCQTFVYFGIFIYGKLL